MLLQLSDYDELKTMSERGGDCLENDSISIKFESTSPSLFMLL